MTRMSSSKGYKEEGEGGKEGGREEEGALRRWLTGQVGPTTSKGGSQDQLISGNTEEGRNEGGTLSRGLIDQVGPTAQTGTPQGVVRSKRERIGETTAVI